VVLNLWNIIKNEVHYRFVSIVKCINIGGKEKLLRDNYKGKNSKLASERYNVPV
jgi:hypothetical protein